MPKTTAQTHTPGPWTIQHETNVMSADGRRAIAPCGGYQNTMSTDATRLENQANARLIAAAPDLLEAARRLLHVIENATTLFKDQPLSVDPNTLIGARATIAKAEGRE